VGRAYALGVNAYVNKSPPGRTLDDVVATIYDHWAKDVVPPERPDRIVLTLVRAADIRIRHARIYQRLAELFADNRTESAFWLSRALAESNITNLLAFIRRQRVDRELPDDILDEMDVMQDRLEGRLTATETAIKAGSISRRDAYAEILELLSSLDVDVVARSIGQLFPVMPVAMAAIRDFIIGGIADVTAWVDLHSLDPVLRERTAQLRVATRDVSARLDSLG
jgi:hypothetical protein